MGSSHIHRNNVPIAVVGLACRLPGDATCPTEYWNLLKEGRDAYSTDTDRYNTSAFYHANPKDRQNVLPTKGGHFIKEDPYAFDTSFFKLTAAEAAVLDPKQRILLEVTYEALENAGLPLPRVAGTRTACIIGTAWSDYRDALVRDFEQWPRLYLMGVSDEMVSNRLSHYFDLRGPSLTVETACSSSLVAIHQACESLRSGQAEMAVAGGINMILGPEATMELNSLGVLNPDGRSLSFDEAANGYGRAEGCGIVVLKPLDQAVRDGDHIRAVIRGSGVNSDGWTKTISTPSGQAQADLIRQVYESNGLDYDSTQYVEAHGTGTKVGDPIELGAIHDTIGRNASESRKLYVGSVKANIGHLEPAAGVAGFIKGVLSLEHGMIPPNVHFHKANPRIPFDKWNMVVPTSLTPWPAAETKRMSVSSFGMGGTNAHVVLEEYQKPAKQLTNGNSNHNHYTSGSGVVVDKKRLFVFSSHDQAGIKRVSDTLLRHLANVRRDNPTWTPEKGEPEYLANLAHTLSTARSSLGWKASCVASSLSQLEAHLAAAPSEEAWKISRASSSSSPSESKQMRIGFVFTGQGAQWAGMGIELLARPVFRDSVARSTAILKSLGCTWDPVAELSKTGKESRLGKPEISQPVCSVLQIALVDEIRSWGSPGLSKPAKVVGHSSGEIAAAYCMGALTHRDALVVAYSRGTASALLPTVAPHLNGAMMAAGCSRETAEDLIEKLGLAGQVGVGCVNSPSSITLSGDSTAIDAMAAALEEQKIFCRRLKVQVAYHSSHVAAVSGEYYQAMEGVDPVPVVSADDDNGDDSGAPYPRMISSVLGDEVSYEQLGPFYWLQNFLSPVLFSDALKTLVQPEGKTEPEIDLLVEIGPHSTLGGPIEQILSHYGVKDVAYQSLLRRGADAVETSLRLAQELCHQGIPLDLAKVNGDVPSVDLLTDLPPYPWMHDNKYNAYPRVQRERWFRDQPARGLLGAPTPVMQEKQHVWRGFIRLDDEPWLAGHKVGDTVVFPAAGMISMVLEAVQQLAEPGKTINALRLRDVSVMAALSILEGVATETVVTISHGSGSSGQGGPWWDFTLSSANTSSSQLRDNCRGLIAIDYAAGKSEHMAREEAHVVTQRAAQYREAVQELREPIAKEDFYEQIAQGTGFKYGELFQGVEDLLVGPGKTHFRLRVTDIGKTFSQGQVGPESEPESGSEPKAGPDNGTQHRRPFLIHAATLDAIFQCWVGATYRNGGLSLKPFAPTRLGAMEIRMDVPGAPDDVMVGYSTNKRHGFHEQTNDMFLFDAALDKMYIAIQDFRIAELDVAGGGAEQDDQQEGSADTVLDGPGGASVTAEVRWDYSVGLFEETDMAKVVAVAQTRPEDGMAKLVSMLLHEKPSAAVVELVQDHKALPKDQGEVAVNSVLANAAKLLPKGAVPPSNVRYAMVNDTSASAGVGGTAKGDDTVAAAVVLVEPLGLQQRQKQETAQEDASSVDILVVPSQVSQQLTGYENPVLDAFVRLAKPNAALVLATNDRQAYEAMALSLQSKGWRVDSTVFADGAGNDHDAVVAVLRYRPGPDPAQEQNGEMTQAHDFVLVVPSTPSSATQDFSKTLQEKLVSQGKNVVVRSWDTIAGSEPEPEPGVTDQASGGKSSPAMVVSLLELEQPMLADLSEGDFHALRSLILKSERILWVTGGGNDDDDPSFYIVDGLARTISNETASLRFQTLHLSSPSSSFSSPSPLPSLVTRILLSDTPDNEFREVEGLLQTARIYKSAAGERRIARHLKDATRIVPLAQEKSPVRLAIGRPGLLDTLHFVKDERTLEPLADTDVEISVRASSINFKDIMGAMGLVPVPMLGLEASGIVVRTGAAVSNVKAGDRVAAHAYGSHATTVRTHHAVVHKLPDSITFEQGAAINLVHVTAYYALVRLAKLRKGQSVLIHAAAGGVGQAAIQLATYLGLVIYVTVGSESKRQLMRERFGIPEAHIFYSRDLSFVKGVERITRGRGVDCILNSLADELLRASWDSGCLAPFGTFVEIGLRDITNNSPLDMRPFVKNATFAFCDILNYPLEDLGAVLGEVYSLVEQGHLSPAHPLKAYRPGQVEEVFRVMQQGKHTGKAVLTFNTPGESDDDTRAPVFQRAADLFRLDPDATYLLVGGMGGLGRSLARNFAAAGARHIAFLSRSGDASAEARTLLSELATRWGVTARAYAADAADETSLRAAMAVCEREMPPVRGVVQLAMVLRDVVFEKMAHAQWAQPLRPKVAGSRNLHEYFGADRPLDFFAMCSSVSGVVGNPGQAAYAAGNTYQDALAAYRRKRGLKAVAVDLGVMRDVGVLAEGNAESGVLGQWEEAVGIPEPIFHALVKSVVHGQMQEQDSEEAVPEQVVTGLGTADVWAAHRLPPPFYLDDPRFGPMAMTTTTASSSEGGAAETNAVSLPSQLAAVSSMQQAAEIVTEALVKRTADILQMPASEVDPKQPLYRYGVDSLTAIEVRNWITRELKANMALLEIVSAVPIREFAAKIAEKSQLVKVTV
ncbi:Reducing polyketide synthase [Colletotrichum higginsianum IMI 349063]|uniref:Reducing polyketide synthase n=1 Tax=Colletotrichum higginsianum (strain IMI 349063) TaxID=759273 RepID=A0A1B7YGR1_COLHI|nr:Reducing polyketide synthase [Colletotrichum higginsianum IMI 349063]OBR11263.1 Reducing polyketide synthase [Colletotrichum higginsianum IMI 349063]